MFETFRHSTQGVGFEEAVAPMPLRKYDPASGTYKCDEPVPFKVCLQAEPATAGAYTGARVRITPLLGVGRPVMMTLWNDPVEWTGVGQGVRVEVERIGPFPVILTGSVSADCPGLDVSHEPVTNLARSNLLDFATATADNAITQPSAFTDCQEAVRAFAMDADALTFGGAMVPVSVTLWGRRTLDGAAVALGTIVVGPGLPGGSAFLRIPVMRGMFDGTAYQAVGFPAVGGGQAQLDVWEEVDP